MILSEAEAKTRWCPFVYKFQAANGVLNNRSRGENSDCMGAGCMCWAWTDGTLTLGYCGLIAGTTPPATTAPGPSPPTGKDTYY